MYWKLDDLLETPVHLFQPANVFADSVSLLVHFHGDHHIADFAVSQNQNWVAATINLGSGASVYEAPFLQGENFSKLLIAIESKLNKPIKTICLSGWSAGYGAIRAIVGSGHSHQIQSIILLDGMHASYIPKGRPIAAGGKIDKSDLIAFEKSARKAISGEMTFIFTHSSVFPGTFASTTECADQLITDLGLKRAAVLKEGPLGMQQVGETKEGNFTIMAFAGNSAPDHVDHLHALYYFFQLIGP